MSFYKFVKVFQLTYECLFSSFQHANGEIWVKFFDGTQLGVKSTATTIKFIDQSGNLSRYQETDILPDIVKSRLKKVPIILEHLSQDTQIQQTTVNRKNPR